MMYSRLMLFVLLCFAQPTLGGTPKNNYEILSELAREASQATGKYLLANTIDTCGVSISNHPAQVLIQSALAALPHVHLYPRDKKNSMLDIEIADFAVRYFRYSESQDSLVREIQMHTKGILNSPSEPMKALPEFMKIMRDTIARSDVSWVENPGYSYTKAVVPEQERSIFTEIAEPVVLFTVAAISVLLLFTIRSQ